MRKPTPGIPVRIICNETQEEFESLEECAKKLFPNIINARQTIWRVCNRLQLEDEAGESKNILKSYHGLTFDYLMEENTNGPK